jgi:hypothetical protein
MSIKAYYYQYNPETEHSMIHDEFMEDDGYELRGRVIASSWLYAKLHFGFGLTPLQAEMLQSMGV